MSKSIQNIEQQDIESLVIILENWLTLLCQMQTVQDNLYTLPTEINSLKKKCDLTNLSEKKLLSDRVASLLSSLDAEIPKLIKLEEKINNIVVLREILEALQQKLKNKPCHKYEQSFERAKLYAAKNKQYIETNISENKSRFAPYKQKISNFWQKKYSITGIVFGVGTLVFYSLYSYHSSPEKSFEAIDNSEAKTEIIEQNN